MFKLTTIIIILLLFFSLNTQAQYGSAAPVKVATVQQLMLAPVRKIPAKVEAKFVATIKAETRGTITTMAEVGAMLQQGEVLARLKDSQIRHRKEELNGAVKSSQAKVTFLKSENTRLNNLLKKNLISASELEQNKADFISARNDLVQAQARLKQLLDQVKKLRIKAPYAGIVLQQFVQPGVLVSSGDNVIEFMQINNLEVIVNVPFKYKSQIKINTIWQIQTADEQIIDVKINRFIPAARGASHTIEVHLSIMDKSLWPGEAVNVLVPTQKREKVLTVPRDALVIRRSGVYVYTVVENKAHKVNVMTGMAQGDFIAVTGLLSVGDTVIVRGNERLKHDQDVKIIE
ncbi:hypothetical protein MNBD_GAMMA01-1562 [hydrothermal vent metagenome]|uniref:YknX-like C-terminal permuted SH3-like domain-containing protein n=1 Tax=hydrothermal vent metagenome TaxID=652676 RepID=A0A3B0VMH5_9ZZZZ